MKRLTAKVLDFHQEGSRQRYQVVIPSYLNSGKRWFRRFTTKDEAIAFAEDLTRDPAGTIAELRGFSAGSRPAPFTRTDRNDAEYLLRAFREKFGTAEITVGLKAFDEYYQSHVATVQISVADAVKEYLEHRKLIKLDDATRADDQFRLGKFVAKFGHLPLAQVTTNDLRKFFNDIPLTAEGKASNQIGYRKKIGPFYTWVLKETKYLKENPITAISKKSLGQMGENNEFYEVDQFERMLGLVQAPEFRDTLFPWFVISGFGGLRSKEAARQSATADAVRWSDIYWNAETPNIHIRKAVGKGGKERHIDASWATATLQAWLALAPRSNGEFVCATQSQIDYAKARFTEVTGIELNENGFRNSFGTYGCAVSGSVAAVSKQMGNSPAVAEKYYIKSLPSGRGKAFFALRPSQPGNVVDIRTGTEG
jgi:integrase